MNSNPRIIRHRPSATGILLALGLALLPWAFGGVAPFALGVPILGFVALAAAVVLEWRDPRRIGRLLGVNALPAGALAALGAFALLQATPLPGALVAWLSPLRAQLGHDAAMALGASTGELPLALAPADARATGLLLLGYAAVFLATALVARERVDRRLLFATVLGSAVAQVVFGAPRWVARAATLWGLALPGDETRLRGSYVNANHLALLLELGLVLAFAWGAWVARRTAHEVSAERRLIALAAPAGLWLVLFAGVAFTESRAGLLAALAATAVQALGLATGGRRRGLAFAGVGLLLLVGLGVTLWLGGGAGFDRLTGTSVYDLAWSSRLGVYASTVELWTRFPFFGCGLGSFRDAFPLVQPADLPGGWTHAHNDYLELLATGGLLAVALLAVGLLSLVGRLRRVLATGRRSEDRFGALAALGALTAAGVHEALDFGLTLPANGLALVVVVAAAAAGRREAALTTPARPLTVTTSSR